MEDFVHVELDVDQIVFQRLVHVANREHASVEEVAERMINQSVAERQTIKIEKNT
jgi:hypothetical protein